MISEKQAVFTKWRVPKTMQWLVQVFFIYLLIFTAFRVATVFFFKPANIAYGELGPSFWLGIKYDLRWISFTLFPIGIASLFPRLSPFYNNATRKFWSLYLGIITLLVLFFYGADFGQFSYVNARLNADALLFAEDPQESLKMVWQSYPVIWILLGVAGALLMLNWLFKRSHLAIEGGNSAVHKFSFRKRWHLLGLLLMCWFMYGFFTSRPLRFDRAFILNDAFKSNLALNPLQNFFTTLRFRKPDQKTNARMYYGEIKSFLQISPTNALNKVNRYSRIGMPASKALEGQPNVVLVICESFSMYKSSMSGNALNATPYFKQLCSKGIFFERCFSPSFGTARGVFATLTGIPDVQLSRFATRNPETVKQRTIINSFEGYAKNYFIGGRSQFNNTGELLRNIKGIRIFEEGSYTSPSAGVWGISDRDLFLEANKVMANETKPFFTIIQTADNHRPYNIANADSQYDKRIISPEELKQNGFESEIEFNAFAHTDYALKAFMDAATKEKYFNNTIFVFVGDHGVEGNALAVYPKVWTEQRLSEVHVPLLFYAPTLLPASVHKEVVSQIDVLPTIAGLMQQPYTNTTLGRNLLDTSLRSNAAFIIQHAQGWIGVVSEQYFYRKNLRIQKEELLSTTENEIALTVTQQDSIKKKMSTLTSAIYETSKWMLLHNKD